MRRRWWFVTLTVVVIALGVLLTLAAIASRKGRLITREAFERIEEGMTSDEVEAVIGLKPGDDTVYRYISAVEAIGPEFLHTRAVDRFQAWNSDNGVILVIFRDGKVIRREFSDGKNAPGRDFLDVLGRLIPGRR